MTIEQIAGKNTQRHPPDDRRGGALSLPFPRSAGSGRTGIRLQSLDAIKADILKLEEEALALEKQVLL